MITNKMSNPAHRWNFLPSGPPTPSIRERVGVPWNHKLIRQENIECERCGKKFNNKAEYYNHTNRDKFGQEVRCT